MLSTTAEYALRIMVALAHSSHSPTTSERIAQTASLPTDYSVKVLQMVARAGLVRAQRGRGGGFQLSCDPAKTTLLDVVNAIDPIERITSCPVGSTGEQRSLCSLHRRLDEVIGGLRDDLAATTLAAILAMKPGPALCQPAKSATVIATAGVAHSG